MDLLKILGNVSEYDDRGKTHGRIYVETTTTVIAAGARFSEGLLLERYYQYTFPAAIYISLNARLKASSKQNPAVLTSPLERGMFTCRLLYLCLHYPIAG